MVEDMLHEDGARRVSPVDDSAVTISGKPTWESTRAISTDTGAETIWTTTVFLQGHPVMIIARHPRSSGDSWITDYRRMTASLWFTPNSATHITCRDADASGEG